MTERVCPLCSEKLKTDALAPGLLWCANSTCRLFIDSYKQGYFVQVILHDVVRDID